MDKFIYVGLGGALGAVCRYAVSLLPWKGNFPILTLITNLIGALLIGVIVGITTQKGKEAPQLQLFLKTGVCGGFTTFSTFSLEALKLLESGEKVQGYIYMLVSVVGCVAGVWMGKKIGAGIAGIW